MFHLYFVVVKNYKYLERSSLRFCPATLHCKLQYACRSRAVCMHAGGLNGLAPQKLIGN